MRLVHLLNSLDDETLSRLAEHHFGPIETLDRAATCLNLEGELRSPKHVRELVFNLQPPAFALVCELLDAEEHAVALTGLRERVMQVTHELSESISAGKLASNQELGLYRRVLTEARRSDLELDPSELALLTVLRRELKIRTVEHFLIEHHADMRHFWDSESAFLDTINTMRSGGLAFGYEGNLVLPDDLVSLVKQVVGIEAPAAARRRILERASGTILAAVAQGLGLKSSGSKEERVNRLLESYVQPSEVLEQFGLSDLRDLCRDIHLPVGGTKQELADRLVNAFANALDIRPEPADTIPPPPEERAMARKGFETLLLSLRQHDLYDILVGIESNRVTGTKEQLTGLILASPYSEATLLQTLASKQLEWALDHAELKTSGSKSDRISRLIDHYDAQRARGSHHP